MCFVPSLFPVLIVSELLQLHQTWEQRFSFLVSVRQQMGSVWAVISSTGVPPISLLWCIRRGGVKWLKENILNKICCHRNFQLSHPTLPHWLLLSESAGKQSCSHGARPECIQFLFIINLSDHKGQSKGHAVVLMLRNALHLVICVVHLKYQVVGFSLGLQRRVWTKEKLWFPARDWTRRGGRRACVWLYLTTWEAVKRHFKLQRRALQSGSRAGWEFSSRLCGC